MEKLNLETILVKMDNAANNGEYAYYQFLKTLRFWVSMGVVKNDWCDAIQRKHDDIMDYGF